MFKRFSIIILTFILLFFGVTVNAEENTKTLPKPAAPALNTETSIPKPDIHIPSVNTTGTKKFTKTPVGVPFAEQEQNNQANVTPIISKTKTATEQSNSINASGSNRANPTKQTYEKQMQNVDFGPYMRDLQRSIRKNWNPPKGNVSKRVVVLFKIANDGTLLSNKIVQTSGIVATDDAALEAVRNTAPFRPLPEGFTGKSVDIQFTFDYNVLSSEKQSGNASRQDRKNHQNNIQTNNTEKTSTNKKIERQLPDSNVQTNNNEGNSVNEQRHDEIINTIQNTCIAAGVILLLIIFVCIIHFFFRRKSQVQNYDFLMNNMKNNIKSDIENNDEKSEESPLYTKHQERTIDLLNPDEPPKVIYINPKKDYTWYIFVSLLIIVIILAYLQSKGYVNLY